MTCTGIFTHVDEGECIEVTGDYVEHAVYGTQFKVEKYRVVPPEDAVAIERYLGSEQSGAWEQRWQQES